MLAAEDWQAWRRLRLRALSEAPYAFESTFEEWAHAPEERWRDRLNMPDSHNLVASIDGVAVGMATGASFDGVYELIGMWVAPAARGRGVGDALIAEVSRWATDRGADKLHLDVVVHNAHAIALYARHGFVDVGPSREADEHGMVKRL